MCADLDVQIGITVLKTDGAMIPGTRLRGIAEAAGFRLADGGRFDWVQEETGAVYVRCRTIARSRLPPTRSAQPRLPGAGFLLDVPRVAEPVRVCDQMKLAAKRMAQTRSTAARRRQPARAGRRRIQVPSASRCAQTATALREVHIEPGSPRALALFGG
jgi:hypothetical protein